MLTSTRASIVLLLALTVEACGGQKSLTAPSPDNTLIENVGQISGAVRDTAFRPLAGATVQMVNGPQTGASTTTDAAGEFVLTPTSRSATQFRASKDGFIASTVTINPNDTYRRIDFSLEMPVGPVNMEGDFKLTIAADPGCPDLPKEARTRTYQATITGLRRNGQLLTTSFGVWIEAPYLENFSSSERFWIGVAGDYVAFTFGGSQPSFVEQLSPTTYVGFGGAAAASVEPTAATIATSFNGFIDYCVMKSEADRPLDGEFYNCAPAKTLAHTQCQSNRHQLILERRSMR